MRNNRKETEMKMVMILLAAGNSIRFGSNKLLYPVEGKPMYLRAMERLLKARQKLQEEFQPPFSCKLAVVTQYGEIRTKAAARGFETLMNDHSEEGISSSMKIGLKKYTDADACLFSVADQPWLTSVTVYKLVLMFLKSGKGIACVSYNKNPGNPCIFSRKYYEELLRLEGDRGGKRVLRKHPEDIAYLEISDKRELEDMDYPC